MAAAILVAMAVCRIPSLLLLLSANAFAQTQGGAVPEVGGSLAQLLLSLVLVVVLIFASLWLLKNLSAPRGRGAGLLHVVAGTAVGSRERVVVVEIGATWLVLGVAPGQVTALAEVPRQAIPEVPEGQKTFAAWIKQIAERRHAR